MEVSNIVLVGYGKTRYMNVLRSLALDTELTFKTAFLYRYIYLMTIELIASGK